MFKLIRKIKKILTFYKNLFLQELADFFSFLKTHQKIEKEEKSDYN